MGIFLKGLSPHLREFQRNNGKLETARPTSATEKKRWQYKLIRDIVENGTDEEDTLSKKRWKQKLKDIFG